MISKIFDKAFHMIFFVIFAIVTFVAICTIFGTNFFGVILAVAFLAVSYAIFPKLQKKFANIDNKSLNIAFLIMLAVMLIVQFILAFNMLAKPVTDWNVINEVSKSYAVNGNMEHIYDNIPQNKDYLARYTNNNGITVLFSFYYRIIYLISGTIPIEAPVILNTLFISASVVFCYLIAKKAFGNFHALITMILCILFLPYYTYCTYFYTDSFSMPFVILSIYLFICGYDSKKIVNKIILFFFSGISCAIGFELKGSAIIVIVAAIIYMIYKGGIKKILLGSGTIIAGFLALAIAFNGLVSSLQITTDETLYKEKYPLTHWVMMGLKNNGGFNQKDSTFTRMAGNYDEKKAANIQEIEKRISRYGVSGLIKHLVIKANFTWSDGTYWIGYHIYKPYNGKNFLHEFFLMDGRCFPIFKSISSGMQLSMLLMICVSLFSCIKKPRFDYITLMHIIVFGVFLFFLVWETRSRYLFNFTPIFIIVWADGIINILNKLKKPLTLKDKLMINNNLAESS
ncbi:MAG: glycosyltransferase family 39 protein [Ruminococcus sp.]|nr:glycosyltransferase family 39 protein [Ruminococcus sp.]